MPQFIKQITNFNQGMTPNKKSGGIARIEHFDTTTQEAFPFRDLVATDMTHGDAGAMKNIVKFTRGASNTIYALGMNVQTAVRPTLAKWDATNKYWNNFQSFNKDSSFAEMLFWYGGNLYGLWRDGSAGVTGYLWKMTPAGSLTAQHVSQNYTNYCNPIFSKATNLEYIGIDNVIYSFDGTSLVSVFAHPLTTFVFTSIAENGIYLNLTGYDTSTLKAESFLWDRNSSVGDVTQKYDLGYEFPVHSVILGGVHFIITVDRTSANIPDDGTQQSKILNIKYVSGDIVKILNSYTFEEIFAYHVNGTNLSVGSYQELDKFYFFAKVKYLYETTYSRVLFALDDKGRLEVAQNIAIDISSENTFPDVIKERDCFWIAGRTAGTWVTTTTYPTTTALSLIETEWYNAKDITKAIKVVGATVDFEPLVAGASVILKTRADAENDWTTIGTFSTDDSVRGSALGTSLGNARYRQFRIESLGNAQIVAFQATFDEVNDQAYG